MGGILEYLSSPTDSQAQPEKEQGSGIINYLSQPDILPEMADKGLTIQPDHAAKVIRLQAKTGLPQGLIERNIDYVESESNKQDFNAADFRKNSPKLAEWMAQNPNHVALAKNDIDSMSAIDTAFSTFKSIPYGFEQGWDKQYLMSELTWNKIKGEEGQNEVLRQKMKSDQGKEFNTGLPSWTRAAADIVGMNFRSVLSSTKEGATGLAIGASGGAVVGAIGGPLAPATVPAGAAVGGLLGLRVGMTAGYMNSLYKMSVSDVYSDLEDVRDEQGNPIDPTVARYASLIAGLPITGLETLAMGKVIKLIPGADKLVGMVGKEQMKKLLIKPSVREAFKDFGKKYAGAVITESSTEGIQKFVSIITREIAKDSSGQDFKPYDKTQMNDDIKSIINESVEAFKGMVVLGALGAGPKTISTYRDIKQSQKNEQFMRSLGENLSGSTISSKSPESVKSYIEYLKKDGDIQNVYIPVDAWEKLFQMDSAKAATEILGSPDQYAEAKAVNGEIIIPLETYAEKLAGTAFHEQLIPDITFKLGEISARQADLASKNISNDIEKDVANIEGGYKADDSTRKVYNDVLGQMLGIKVTRQEAERVATLESQRQATRASILGVDPWELWQERPKSFLREIPDVLKNKEVDMILDPLLDQLRAGKEIKQKEIFGTSLVEFLKEKGGLLDQGGELSSMDVDVERKRSAKKLVQSKGMTLDNAAELAAEHGYIDKADINGLLDAIDRETRGEPVYIAGKENHDLLSREKELNDLNDYLNSIGADTGKMDNAEIRKMIKDQEVGTDFLQTQLAKQEAFYSQLSKAFNDAPDKIFGNGKQVAMWLQGNSAKLGVKADEIHWSGVTDWLSTQPKVTKADVLAYLDANGVRVEVEMLGENKDAAAAGRVLAETDGNVWDELGTANQARYIRRGAGVSITTDVKGEPKFAQYQLPGGQNYQEMFITMPAMKGYQWKDGHDAYSGIQNPIVRIRMNERTDADGNRVLFLEEIQKPQKEQEKNMPPGLSDPQMFTAIALKRIISYAIDNGFDKVAWANGTQQAERYDLSKQISRVTYEPETKLLQAFDKNSGGEALRKTVEEKEIADYIGKDAAEKLINQEARVRGDGVKRKLIEGDNLKVGGEGMKGYYDQIIPQVASKIIEKFGGKIESVKVGTGINTDDTEIRWFQDGDGLQVIEWGDNRREFNTDTEAKAFRDELKNAISTQQGFTLTPEMRSKVMNEGMPLFQKDSGATRSENSVHPLAGNAQIETPEFKKWFGDSKAVDESGRPKVFYHGTASDITEFRPKQAQAIFVTADTVTANSFANASKNWTKENGLDGGGNVMPLYISVNNPFDPDNTEHINALKNAIGNKFNGEEFANTIDDVAEGRWKAMENPVVQKYIKAKHDGFFVYENGQKNIAVYKSEQIKSAIGNRGTFDPVNQNILFSKANNGNPTLIIQHNLTEQNLLHAERMGGIPVPSLGITNVDHPMMKFGEITLIGGVDMADPKGYAATKVYGADIYSPRYPELSYKLDKSVLDNLNEKLSQYNKSRKIYGGELNSVGDLVNLDAFQNFAEAKGIPKNSYYEQRDIARELLHEVGAEEKIFQGYTNQGNIKYIPHTLDNVVKLLKKQLVGGEGTNYGIGSIRSKYAPKLKSLAGIRKAKDRLMTADTFAKVKNEIDKEFFALSDEFRSFHPIGEKFGFLDTMSSTIYDAATMGLARAFKENGFKEVPTDKLKYAAEFLDKLRTLPTEYFEAKILRTVELSEFKGAIVPDGISQKTIEALKNRGITNILRYKDEADRATKIKQLVQEADLLFSKGLPKNTDNPHTVESIKQPIIDAFDGKIKLSVQSMLDNGKLKIITNSEAKNIFGDELSDFTTEGFYNPLDKTSYLIADNISRTATSEYLKGLVLHEVAIHAVRLGQNNAEFNKILKTVEDMINNGDESAIQALKSLPDDTLSRDVNEETLAYLIQQNPSLTIVQRFYAWLRKELRKIGFTEITQNDLVYMAHQAMLQHDNYSTGNLALKSSRRISEDGFNPLFQNSINKQQGSIPEDALGMYSRTENAITLFRKANPSTVLHELGHSWLEELRLDAQRENAPQKLIDDWNTIKAWAKINETDLDKISVESHEQFARGIEAYVMEGKSPSTELQNVFSRFTHWLVRIYKNIKALNVEISPEVSAVFDRMLATDEQISRAREIQGYAKPLLNEVGMTKFEYEVYQKINEQAKNEATDAMRAKIMDELIREQSEWWKKERTGMREEVALEIDASPTYHALSWLRKGIFPDGSKLEGIEPMKLSKDALVRRYGEAFLNSLPRPYIYQQEGGLHPDMAAEYLGFNTGEELVKALAEAKPRNKLIDAETDQRMKHKYGDMMIDGSIADEADFHVNNDRQAEVFLYEMKVLKRRGSTRNISPKESFQKIAHSIIQDKKVGDIDQRYYEHAARKAGQEAENALLGKDMKDGLARNLDLAFDAKQRQLLNLLLFKEAVLAKTKIESAEDRFLGMFKKDEKLAKTHNMDMVNAARAISAQHGIGGTEKSAMAYLEQMREYDPDTYEDMKNAVDFAISDSKPFKQLTVAEFSMVQDSIDGLWELSITSQQITIGGKRLQLKSIIAELGEKMKLQGEPKAKRGYAKAVTKWDKTKIGLLGIKSSLSRVESWVSAMDKGNFNGEFRRYIWQPVSIATTHYREMRRKTLKKYLELVKLIEGTITSDKISATELGYTFGEGGSGRSELLGAMLHTGNKSNLQKLLRGRHWGEYDENGVLDTSRWDAFILRMHNEGILTKRDHDFVQSIWDLNESLKPDAQKAHKAMYGYYFDEITAEKFNTPFGEYRGGYMPAIVDPFIADDASIRVDQEALKGQSNSFIFPTTGREFAKNRKAGYAKPLIMDLRQVSSHLDKVLKFTYIEPSIKEVSRLVMNNEFRTTLSEFVDTEVASQMLVPWLQRTARQTVETVSTDKTGRLFDKIWKEIRSRTGLQIMTLNVTNALQGFTGLSLSLIKVKPSFLAAAMGRYTSGPEKYAGYISEKSEFMRNRVHSQAFEMMGQIDNILINPGKFEKARDFSIRHGYFLQAGIQHVIDIITWGGAYDQAILQGVDELVAVQMADSAVRQTQGSFSAEDISRFETGSPFMRAFTMFYTYYNMQANLLGTEFSIALKRSGFSGTGRALYIYTFGFMIPAVISELIVQAMSGNLTDDEDEGWADWLMMFFGGQTRTALAMIPGIGATIQTGINAFNDKWYDDRMSTSPAVAMIESTAHAPFSVLNAIENDGSQKKAIKDMLTAIGMVTGLPVAPLGRPAGYLADILQGKKDEPDNPIEFGRGLITGK